jgi:hypothetical protein
MLGLPEDAETYRKRWKPSRTYLHGFPASTIYEQPAEQKAVSLQINRAVVSGKITPSGFVGLNQHIDPSTPAWWCETSARTSESRKGGKLSLISTRITPFQP